VQRGERHGLARVNLCDAMRCIPYTEYIDAVAAVAAWYGSEDKEGGLKEPKGQHHHPGHSPSGIR
jgi:hypothetical protein